MKTFVRQHFEDFVNRQDLAAADRNFAQTFVDHDGPAHRTVGVVDDKAMMANMYRQLPDLRVVVEDIIAEHDRVVCRNTWRGTEAASGRTIVFTGIVIWRLEGGKIVERWASIQPPQTDVVHV
jgi:predicted ester cyclase